MNEDLESHPMCQNHYWKARKILLDEDLKKDYDSSLLKFLKLESKRKQSELKLNSKPKIIEDIVQSSVFSKIKINPKLRREIIITLVFGIIFWGFSEYVRYSIRKSVKEAVRSNADSLPKSIDSIRYIPETKNLKDTILLN